MTTPKLTDEYVLGTKWYVKPDDLIGAWCITLDDKMPSEGAIQIGSFMTEKAAAYLVDLHNQSLMGSTRGRVLERLARIWEQHPDMRLGQLIENVYHHESPDHCFYHVSDEEFVSKLENFYEGL